MGKNYPKETNIARIALQFISAQLESKYRLDAYSRWAACVDLNVKRSEEKRKYIFNSYWNLWKANTLDFISSNVTQNMSSTVKRMQSENKPVQESSFGKTYILPWTKHVYVNK